MTLNELLCLVLHEMHTDKDTTYWVPRDDISYDAPLLTEDQYVLSARLSPDDSTGVYPTPPNYVEFYFDDEELDGSDDNEDEDISKLCVKHPENVIKPELFDDYDPVG